MTACNRNFYFTNYKLLQVYKPNNYCFVIIFSKTFVQDVLVESQSPQHISVMDGARIATVNTQKFPIGITDSLEENGVVSLPIIKISPAFCGAQDPNVVPVNSSNAIGNRFALESRHGAQIFGVTFWEFYVFGGQAINNCFCCFVNDTAHHRYSNPKLICNSTIINPLTQKVQGHCHLSLHRNCVLRKSFFLHDQRT